MKSTFLKLFIATIIIGSFSLQSFSPSLPNLTTIKITDLYWIDASNVHQDYYAAKITVCGPVVEDPTQYWTTSNINLSMPRTDEYFPTDYQHYYITGGNLTGVALSVQKTSTSSWEFLGNISSDDCRVTRYMTTGNYMYMMEFSKGAVGYCAPVEE